MSDRSTGSAAEEFDPTPDRKSVKPAFDKAVEGPTPPPGGEKTTEKADPPPEHVFSPPSPGGSSAWRSSPPSHKAAPAGGGGDGSWTREAARPGGARPPDDPRLTPKFNKAAK